MSRVSLAFVCLATILASTELSAQAAPRQSVNDAIFLLGRARYFHGLVEGRHCETLFRDRTRLLNQRYLKAYAAIAALFPDTKLQPAVDVVNTASGDCADGGTLLGFEDKVVSLEQFLVTGK